MKTIVPDEIIGILKKLDKFKRENGKPLVDQDKQKLDTWLCSLETAVINPINGKECLVNPIPKEPDLSITREETMIDRIRHINTVSARVNEMRGQTTKEEVEDFDNIDLDDLDDHPMPKSIFAVADHEITEMEPDNLSPSEEKTAPNPDLKSEADISTSSPADDPTLEEKN